MSASEAMATSLRVITAPSTSQDASKSRRLAHLSALVKMWQKREAESDNYGLRLHEIMLWQVLTIKDDFKKTGSGPKQRAVTNFDGNVLPFW